MEVIGKQDDFDKVFYKLYLKDEGFDGTITMCQDKNTKEFYPFFFSAKMKENGMDYFVSYYRKVKKVILKKLQEYENKLSQ